MNLRSHLPDLHLALRFVRWKLWWRRTEWLRWQRTRYVHPPRGLPADQQLRGVMNAMRLAEQNAAPVVVTAGHKTFVAYQSKSVRRAPEGATHRPELAGFDTPEGFVTYEMLLRR